jgi:adenine deaminase
MIALKARKLKAYKDLIAQASHFEKMNIPFAFSCLDVKTKEFKSNLRSMLDAGLSERTAIAALTTVPASILGVQSMVGTVEKGKMANLVISDKPYFDEKSTVKFVFVDGKLYDYNEAEKKGDKKDNLDKDEEHFLNAVWSFTVEIPGGSQTGTLNFFNAPSETKVILKSDNDGSEDRGDDIAIKDKNVVVKMNTEIDGSSVPIVIDITFDGKTFTGTVSLEGMGSFPINGEKKDNPKND